MRSNLVLGQVYPTVLHMLSAAVVSAPEGIAITGDNGDCVSYGELWRRVNRAAASLAAHGVAGQRVGVLGGNTIETVVSYFAVLSAGSQLLLLNPRYTPRELAGILADATPEALIADAACRDKLDTVLRDSGTRATGLAANTLITNSAAERAAGDVPEIDPDSLALLQYTGGTSGKPKGVNLTHRAIATNVAQREALLPTMSGCERVLCVMPIFHSYGFCMGVLLAFNARGTLMLMQHYHAQTVFDTIRREGITIFPGNPAIYTGLLSDAGFDPRDWSTVHTCYSGSAALPESTLNRWQTATGIPILEGYGQTEAGSILTFNPAGARQKVRSVGVPVAATDVEIVDPESGTQALGVNEHGEIRARGPQIMAGYRNRPSDTEQTLREGWLYTGDIGYIDSDGYLFISDRKKDLVIVSGFNVYPREVEDVLHSHPKVIEAAVIGVPDPDRGEILRAFVVVRGDAPDLLDDIAKYCRAQLAGYKSPAVILALSAMPKTAANKTDKLALKKLDSNDALAVYRAKR